MPLVSDLFHSLHLLENQRLNIGFLLHNVVVRPILKRFLQTSIALSIYSHMEEAMLVAVFYHLALVNVLDTALLTHDEMATHDHELVRCLANVFVSVKERLHLLLEVLPRVLSKWVVDRHYAPLSFGQVLDELHIVGGGRSVDTAGLDLPSADGERPILLNHTLGRQLSEDRMIILPKVSRHHVALTS